MRNKILFLILALLQWTIPAQAADSWQLDGSRSGAQFRVRIVRFCFPLKVCGSVSGIHGKAEYDGKSLSAFRVSTEADGKAISTGDSNVDSLLRGQGFLDVNQFPTIVFQSKSIHQEDSGYKLYGDLTMHGVTRPVVFNLDPPAPVRMDQDGNLHLAVHARSKVACSDFGMDGGRLPGATTVRDAIDLTLNVELMKKQRSLDTASLR